MRLLKIPILLLLFFFVIDTVQAQTLSKKEYEEAIDYMNCQIGELSLKDQPKRPHYDAYLAEVGDMCDYFNLYEFLNTRKPKPLEASLYLCQHINSYKNNYSSSASNRKLYYLLSNEFFADSTMSAFAAKHPENFPEVKENLKRYLTNTFLNNDTPQDFDISTTKPTDAVDTVITIPDEEPVKDVVLDKPEKEAVAEIDQNMVDKRRADRKRLARQLLVYGLSLIAIILIFWYGLKWMEKRQKTLSPENSTTATFSKNKQIEELNHTVSDLKNKVAQQKAEIEKLSDDIVDDDE